MDMTTDFEDENLAMAEATRFCGANRWLVDADPIIAEMMRSATTDLGFAKEFDPSRAVVVMSNKLSTTDIDGTLIAALARKWWYLTDIDGCATRRGSANGELISDCHRCGDNPLDIWDKHPAENIVHIPRGRFVVEFALCRSCTDHFESLATAVTERKFRRIASDDTYVEFTETRHENNG